MHKSSSLLLCREKQVQLLSVQYNMNVVYIVPSFLSIRLQRRSLVSKSPTNSKNTLAISVVEIKLLFSTLRALFLVVVTTTVCGSLVVVMLPIPCSETVGGLGTRME